MWKYKSCPRCRGDIYIDEDLDRTYIKCLQCGYERELPRKILNTKDGIVAGTRESIPATS